MIGLSPPPDESKNPFSDSVPSTVYQIDMSDDESVAIVREVATFSRRDEALTYARAANTAERKAAMAQMEEEAADES